MIIVEGFHAGSASPTHWLTLGFEARCKSRLRARLDGGEEIGLFLDRGHILRGGDLLQGRHGEVIEVCAAAERVTQACCDDALLLARAAYHLGNRHVAVQLLPGALRIQADAVLGQMLTGLGLQVSELDAPFEPEAGAYGGHAAHHAHAHAEQTGARLHVFSQP